MITQISSSTNFNAKLDYSRLKCNKKRLSNVAKIFERKTKNYPNDTFEIFGYPDEKDRLYFEFSGPQKRFETEAGCVLPSVVRILKKLSDTNLAEELKKLFILKKKDYKFEEDGLIFDKKNQVFKKLEEHKIRDEVYDKFMNAFFELKHEYINSFLKEEDILGKPNGVSIALKQKSNLL